MFTYPNLELKALRSNFNFFSTGLQELQCNIWVGKHTLFSFVRPVLNSPDRDVLKNGFKSCYGCGTVESIFHFLTIVVVDGVFFPIVLSALQCKIWVGKQVCFPLLRPFLDSPDRDVHKTGLKS